MIGLFVFLFVLGVLVMVHEFGHFIAARKVGVKVEKFSLGFGPRLFTKKKGDTEYSLSAIPLGGYVKLAGDSIQDFKGNPDDYFAKPVGKRFWIIFSGPALNYILGIFCFWMIFFLGYPNLTTKVGGLMDEFGAKQAGVLLEDRVVGIDGKPVKLWQELQTEIQTKKDADKVNLIILRQGKEINLSVPLKKKEFSDIFGHKTSIVLLGIMPADETVISRHGFVQSFILSCKRTIELTTMTYKALYYMVLGKMSFRQSMTGPLGIYNITSKVAGQGILAVLGLIGLLSISLGIFNLLPLPVLDGGHIVLLGIEKIRGKALGIKADQIINQIGFTFIIALAVFVTYNDIMRLWGDKLKHIIK